jgi:hypothetical protein
MNNRQVTISSGNSKMGKIYSVSLPPVLTCREDAPCKKGCYAMKGAFLYANVKSSYQNNLDFFNEDAKGYELSILKQLPMYGVFRWSVSGDIVNNEYLEMMIRIAKKLPNVKFLAFTKKYELINEYLLTKKLPKNLKVVFSAWKGLEFENPNKLSIAYVYDKNNIDERIPKNALPCNGDCSQCMVCWGLKKSSSVVFNKH